ncbi:hypothetical protein DAPPUDRAFT_315291 [Daphnia pulex]|uniref:Uncharacterized protein n=1 Tax=Daphnia pulex TaxID=6669 RepID=E9G9B5_DAPPU|nr:hypothetical protein DAPPUDRAFT_315291 [Daphnia pulex]|eukprot:EFX84113.1 hypothetical protein DAPPUDRAFT_315291 [Daphnia pulex]
MFAVYLIAAVVIAQTQSAAIPESETVPIETVIIETKENKEAKSSVDTVDFALLEYTEKDHAKDIDSYLDTAVQADKFGCGSRLICELHRRAESELLPEEVLLRSMFDGKPLAVSSDGPKVAKGRGVFQYAAFIGSTAKNSETCSRAFSRCPFDSDTILIVFRAIGSSPALKSLQHPFPSHKLQPPKEVTSA